MDSANYEAPKDAGKRLLTAIIDDVAKNNPKQCFMSIPRSSGLSEGLRDISYAEMARAIDRCAWWLEEKLGKGVDFPTIATYLSPMDFRHVILIFGSIKSGYKVGKPDDNHRHLHNSQGMRFAYKSRCSTVHLVTALRFRLRF